MVTNNTVEQHETYPGPSSQAVKSDVDLKADVSSKGSMEIGTSITIPILARKEWNNTQIRLAAGEEYHFKASGQWTDWYIVCDADGWSYSGLLSPLNLLLLEATKWSRRVPEERLFTLIGSIDQKAPYFGIGVEARIAPESTGTLYCFANDVSFMYWNNWGEIQLTITRTR
jgi:hypothetical protein